MNIYQEYAEYTKRMQTLWDELCVDLPFDNIFQGLSAPDNRNYDRFNTLSGRDGLRFVLEHTGLGFVYYKGYIQDDWKDLGVIGKRGDLLLNGRYIVPIRDVVGNIIAIVGWKKNSNHKYVTCASRHIKARRTWFGMEQMTPEGMESVGLKYNTSHKALLCEGIFDTLAARSLGYTAYGVTGIYLSREQKESEPLLAMGGKLVGVPDMDDEGNKVVKYDNWNLSKYNGTYLRFDNKPKNCKESLKDIDDLACFYGENLASKIVGQAFDSDLKVIRQVSR